MVNTLEVVERIEFQILLKIVESLILYKELLWTRCKHIVKNKLLIIKKGLKKEKIV